jgi:hypothetical protein
MAWEVEWLANKHEVLSLNPSTSKTKSWAMKSAKQTPWANSIHFFERLLGCGPSPISWSWWDAALTLLFSTSQLCQ